MLHHLNLLESRPGNVVTLTLPPDKPWNRAQPADLIFRSAHLPPEHPVVVGPPPNDRQARRHRLTPPGQTVPPFRKPDIFSLIEVIFGRLETATISVSRSISVMVRRGTLSMFVRHRGKVSRRCSSIA
jgi:hypothetical protein